jgi:hypothetical protein
VYKTLLTAGSVFGFTMLASAQQLPNTQPMLAIAHCMPADQYAEYVVREFGEEPVLMGWGFVDVADENFEPRGSEGMLVVTANFDTGTFSINITYEDGINCTLMQGLEFAPWPGRYPEGEPT